MTLDTDAPVVAVATALWGPIRLAATSRGVVALEVFADREGFLARVEARTGQLPCELDEARSTAAGRIAAAAIEAVDEVVAGRDGQLDEVALDLRGVRSFDREVFEAVRSIPRGRASSYGRVARLVGRPGAARAVGGAVGRNPVGLLVPCHRVVAGDGSLGGYGGDAWGSRDAHLSIKLALLELEGVAVPVRDLL